MKNYGIRKRIAFLKYKFGDKIMLNLPVFLWSNPLVMQAARGGISLLQVDTRYENSIIARIEKYKGKIGVKEKGKKMQDDAVV